LVGELGKREVRTFAASRNGSRAPNLAWILSNSGVQRLGRKLSAAEKAMVLKPFGLTERQSLSLGADFNRAERGLDLALVPVPDWPDGIASRVNLTGDVNSSI